MKKVFNLSNKANFTILNLATCLFLVSVFVFSNYVNKIKMANIIVSAYEQDLKEHRHTDALHRISAANSESFEAIGYFKNDKRVFTLPSSINPSFFRNRTLVNRITNHVYEVPLFFDRKKTNKSATLKFSFNFFDSIIYGVAAWFVSFLFLLRFFAKYKRLTAESHKNEMIAQKSEIVGKVIEGVDHDIRTPLQAFEEVVTNSNNLSDSDRETLLEVRKRLKGIISDLKTTWDTEIAKTRTKKNPDIHVQCAVSQIINEKKATYSSKNGVDLKISIEESARDAFIKVPESKLKRALSNIIDNSAEAINKQGEIAVKIKSTSNTVIIEVSDNGKGIPDYIKEKLGKEKITFGKENGKGIGLASAFELVESWGGKIKISSILGEGTDVKVHIPRKRTPSWFQFSFNIKKLKNISVIDDDELIFQKWKNRIAKENIKASLSYYPIGLNFLEENSSNQDTFCFVDYELRNQKLNGIDIINKGNIKDKSVLVTNRFHDAELQEICKQNKIKMFPKFLIQDSILS